MFIKVTDNGEGTTIFVNTDKIVMISPYILRGYANSSLIALADGVCLRVKEPTETIMGLIERSENTE